jgi:hypothetical protein
MYERWSYRRLLGIPSYGDNLSPINEVGMISVYCVKSAALAVRYASRKHNLPGAGPVLSITPLIAFHITKFVAVR